MVTATKPAPRTARRTALGASPWALLLSLFPGLGACNALTGLGQNFDEVDCFHGKGNCADGSIPRGQDGDVGPGDGALIAPGDDGPDLSDGSQPSNPDGSSPPPSFTPDGSSLPDGGDDEGSAGSTCVDGGTCDPSDCHMGTLACGDAGAVCVSTGTLGDGTHCGTTGHVCLSGTCVSCTDNSTCTPANECHTGATSCSTGRSLCVDNGGNVDNLTPCGTAGAGTVCETGSCVVEPKRYVFLSKGTFTASSGIGAADAMCASEATAASLPGTYIAALSTTTTSVQGRFASNGPRWFLVNGTLFGDWMSAFSFLAPSIPLEADGTARPPDVSGGSDITTWTGCDDGANEVTGSAASSCADWTSTASSTGEVGDALGGGATAHLVGWGTESCMIALPVYCFQK